jgi:hypothetical protein
MCPLSSQKNHFDNIPGLFVYHDYLTPSECNSLVEKSLELYKRLEEGSATHQLRKADIPQPEFVRSAKHNLASEEFYTSLTLHEASQRSIRCEYFPRYGEIGHSLCYFRGNTNLPDIVHDILPFITSTMQDAGLTTDKELMWKLTMNFYKSLSGVVAGFPFHVDIPANGVVTMILNIQREVLFQIAKDETIIDINLPPGSLLVLSGESRYQWKHRVLPMTSNPSTNSDIERISLVLGFQ